MHEVCQRFSCSLEHIKRLRAFTTVIYVDDECYEKLWKEQMKWKLMMPFICPAKVIYFMYFVFVGNGLFPPNCLDHISKWCANAPISITYDHGQHFPFVPWHWWAILLWFWIENCILHVVSRSLYCLIKCDMRKGNQALTPVSKINNNLMYIIVMSKIILTQWYLPCKR